MCLEILQDTDCYEVLVQNPTPQYARKLKELVSDALTSKIISKQEYEFLIPTFPVISTFYGLPKIHKGLSPLKGRPIVSGVNNLTQNASLFVDKVLCSFVTSLPSYTRDTTDLLLKLDGVVADDNMLLASIDVEALYSSIPHEYGSRAVHHF